MAEGEHGSLYWLLRHSRDWVTEQVKRHLVKFLVGVGALAILAILFRPYLHRDVLWVRTHLFLVVMGVPVLAVWWQLVSRGSFVRRFLAAAVGALLAWPIGMWGDDVHEYLSLYYRYQTLTVVELDQLPTTAHERIHPRNSIYSLAFEAMGEVETPTLPQYVQVRPGIYHWTSAIEPAYWIPRMFGGVDQVLSIPGDAASPSFQKQSRTAVRFETGETLLFGRNLFTAVVKRFGPWQFFNYQPEDVIVVPDDHGQMVQVVKLTRWRGVLFPRPEFGGVIVVNEGRESIVGWLKRIFVGVGYWVRPEDVRKHAFLTGQHVMPYTVSRNIGNAFRFQDGFMGPFPGVHQGDVRIPDLVADVNPQPFTIHVDGLPNEPGQLVHYFGLEPFDPDKQALNTSLFIPADGHSVVYVYRHHRRGENLAGVSTVSTKVKESRKQYSWAPQGPHLPVEHLPYIPLVNGQPRFFWRTTVVTKKEAATPEEAPEGVRFIASGMPEVAITDPAFNRSIWVDSLHEDTWVTEVAKEFAPVWSTGKAGP